MKPSQALRALLLILVFSQNVECRPVQAQPYYESASIDNRGEYFSKDELLNDAPDFAGSVPLGKKYTGPHRMRDGTQSDQMVTQPLEETSAKETSNENHTPARGNKHHNTAADAGKNKIRKPTERVNVEIIERPKELKVFVNRSPSSKKQSITDEEKKDWKHVQREMLEKGKKGQDKSVLNEDWTAKIATESKEFNEEVVDDSDITGSGDDANRDFAKEFNEEVVDDSDITGSGDDANRDFANFHDVLNGGSFMSRDDAHHRRAKLRHAHQKKRPENSFGGLGILWSLVVFAFVLLVIAMVFLRRWCCLGKMREDVELESVKVEHNRQVANQNAIKEARINVGKRKSLENRKVLRKLSMDQGVTTVGEELAIACSIIAPSIETRRKNSEALHTRACVRAATSRRNSSFQEDLMTARCEFANAPARFAKLVSLAGDEKATEANKDSEEPGTQSAGDKAVAIDLE